MRRIFRILGICQSAGEQDDFLAGNGVKIFDNGVDAAETSGVQSAAVDDDVILRQKRSVHSLAVTEISG